MAMRFDLTLDMHTAEAIRKMAHEITVVSAERIAEELRKILVHPRRAFAMKLMEILRLIPPIFPEPNNLLTEMKDLPQGLPSAPNGDLWDHILQVLEVLEGPTYPKLEPVSFPLGFAALLHDIGKRRSMGRTPEKYTFYGHEQISKQIAEKLCKKLKVSNEEKDRILWLVEKHQYLCDAPNMKLSRLKRILVHPGIGELLALHKADSIASRRSIDHVLFCEDKLREWSREEIDPPPIITGDDLIAQGMEPGPKFKEILDRVRDAQLEGLIKTFEEGMRLAEELSNRSYL
jgi:poly(A) polymerase